MRNLGLLNKKMSGWKPVDTVIYLKKCENASHSEAEFVDLLCAALKKIDEAAKSKRIFLYNMPSSSWDADTQTVCEKAQVIFDESFGADIAVTVKKFQPEPEYNYFYIKAKQNGEEVELLFLEELK